MRRTLPGLAAARRGVWAHLALGVRNSSGVPGSHPFLTLTWEYSHPQSNADDSCSSTLVSPIKSRPLKNSRTMSLLSSIYSSRIARSSDFIMRKTALLSLFTFALSALAQSPSPAARTAPAIARPSSAAFAAMETISPDRIRAHVRFLSHDLLEGRGTGQRGGDLAAEYIATQFAEHGLKPAGDHGTFMQKVPLVGITTLPETRFSLIPKQGETMNLKPLDEYVAYDQSQQAESDVDAEVVFVGYGIQAPEYNWDDYKGVDVRGKVLLMLVNEPQSDDLKFFKGKALTYYGRWTYKYEEGLRKGAVGVLLIHQSQMASYPWEVVRNSNSGEKSFLKVEGPGLKVASWIHLDVATRLAAASGMNLDKMMTVAQSRDFRPVNLGARLKAHMVSKVRSFESNNVVAVLPGNDKRVSDEAVMYTAHYDHFGIRPDMPGDNIFNGADDNATGCGI